jgi:hypothetical protein
VGNRLCFFCKSKQPLIHFNPKRCNWLLRQHYKPKAAFSFAALYFINQKIKLKKCGIATPCSCIACCKVQRTA